MTGFDETLIQVLCTESTLIVSMCRIDTMSLLHASTAAAAARKQFDVQPFQVFRRVLTDVISVTTKQPADTKTAESRLRAGDGLDAGQAPGPHVRPAQEGLQRGLRPLQRQGKQARMPGMRSADGPALALRLLQAISVLSMPLSPWKVTGCLC